MEINFKAGIIDIPASFKVIEMKLSMKSPVIFTMVALITVGLTMYFTLLILKYPLVGIEVKKINGSWIVEKVYDKSWAHKNNIEKGSIVNLVNGLDPGKHNTVLQFKMVEMAESITITDNKSKTNTFAISYNDLDSQLIVYLFLPFFFAISTFILSLLLYYRKKEEGSALILIFFLWSLGLCYLSASSSARADLAGRIITTITFSGSIVLLIHFLKSYFSRFNLEFIKDSSLKILYGVYLLVITTLLSSFFFHNISSLMRNIELGFFFLLLSCSFFLLARCYFRYKNSEGKSILKILLVTLIIAFSPFVLLYAVPYIFLGKRLLSAEIAAVFLLVIPLTFVYLQLAEKLFDIDFLLGRLRYYSLLAFPFTLLFTIMLATLFKIRLISSSFFLAFSLLFAESILFLYLKEYIDYKIRHHFFSQKSDFETSLYSFFQRAKYETKVNSLIYHLMNEIRDVLRVKTVLYIEVFSENEGMTWLLKNKRDYPAPFVEGLEKIKWENHRIGSVNEVMDGFGIVIGGDQNNKSIIFCGMKKSKTNLNIQERIWLETLAYFSSILLENFQLIEGLFEKIEDYKKRKEMENGNYPYWFSRLMFSLSEKERTNLSIDLHDSVLQDQLQLLRKVEKIKGKVTDISIKNDLSDLKERLLDNIHLIRETCNELRPPFLSELGIIQSIQNLIEQIKLRSNFILRSELDPSIQRLDNEYELTLYRVVQELLNNAMKHSLASEVVLTLRKNKHILLLTYRDNGKGIDMTRLNDSFKTIGIFGIKERVKSIGGTIKITSAPGKGTEVLIEIKTGGTEND